MTHKEYYYSVHHETRCIRRELKRLRAIFQAGRRYERRKQILAVCEANRKAFERACKNSIFNEKVGTDAYLIREISYLLQNENEPESEPETELGEKPRLIRKETAGKGNKFAEDVNVIRNPRVRKALTGEVPDRLIWRKKA